MKILLFFLFLPSLLFAKMEWQQSSDGFFAKVEVSPKEVSILDTIQVDILLKYPKGYKPRLDLIRENILDYSGFSDSPFTIRSETTDERSGETQLQFVLNPQLGGTHAVTPRDIHFTTIEGEDAKVFISDIFNVTVTVPKGNPEYSGQPAPLIAVNSPEPIEISQANLLEWVNNPEITKESSQQILSLKESRTKPFTTLTYLLIFALIIGFIILVIEQNPNRKVAAKKQQKTKFRLNVHPWDSTQPEDRYLIKIAEVIRDRKPDASLKEPYQSLIKKAERVKFARYKPTEVECREAYRVAQKLLSR